VWGDDRESTQMMSKTNIKALIKQEQKAVREGGGSSGMGLS